jgi:hypothetical protein
MKDRLSKGTKPRPATVAAPKAASKAAPKTTKGARKK